MTKVNSVIDTEMLNNVTAFASLLHYTEDQAYSLEIRSLSFYHHAILLAKEGLHHRTTELRIDSMAAASAMLDYMGAGVWHVVNSPAAAKVKALICFHLERFFAYLLSTLVLIATLIASNFEGPRQFQQ